MSATSRPVLEAVPLSLARVPALLDMLLELERNGESRHFAPHPFTPACLEALCAQARQDLHYVFAYGDRVLAYGLLRGWDQGFAVPSLGIAVRPDVRGKGYGLAMMQFLHCAARVRDAERVRLRVHPDNAVASAMYARLGYDFDPQLDGDGLRVAHKRLTP